jgi:pimeloyl-ACP methyl ester carboxylesterase
VTVAGALGALPAWYVPATGNTWVVMVHGKGGLRREFLRTLPLVHAAGMPALVVTYRNDAGNTQDPSAQFGYGATEWPDLQAAVDWATAHGAQNVVLYGNSMGGALVAAFLQHSDRAHLVRGVVFDSAMLDFSAAVELGASQNNLPVVGLSVPSSLTWTAERIAGVRFGIDWAALDYVSDPTWVKVPVLAIHGDADPTVPASVSQRLAAAHPDLALYGPMDPAIRGGVIPFNIPGIHPHDVAQLLDRSGVAVRAGHHCTMPLHERLDLPATARASFNVYTTRDDIDALIAGIGEVKRVFGA